MRGKFKYLILTIFFGIVSVSPPIQTKAISCPDLRIVFVRGSGGERWVDDNYLEFKETIEKKLKTVDLNYEFIDLDYPAVGVGVNNLKVTAGAYFGAGEAYEFGDSVKAGVKNLDKLVNSLSCPETKYVIGGYSQGAMVLSRALKDLNPNRVIYAATFGDPKIYLPEGKGLIPAACRGENLSEYRMYVPDCQAYRGLLGANEPYQPAGFSGKVGTWCNRRDIFCSSKFNMSDHTAYISENLYEDASRVIFDKITKHFGLTNTVSSPHDTVILIDSTGSMEYMIDKYKNEALRLAEETFKSGGRVALYDYRDLDDLYIPVEHCNFGNCNIDIFKQQLDKIKTGGGGGDFPESLLSASFHVMKKLDWKIGATKSLVILTDAHFLSPDRDGTTMHDVVKLSKSIDPVNFYIITEPGLTENYLELANSTDGMVVTNFNELGLLTDYIMDRYDSLPRVEESLPLKKPELKILDSKRIADNEFRVVFETDAPETLIVMNERVIGITNEKEIIISEVDFSKNNVFNLVPLKDGVRGENIEISFGNSAKSSESIQLIPKAPNTGQR